MVTWDRQKVYLKHFVLEQRTYVHQKYLHNEINFLIKMFVENGRYCNYMLAVINK